MSYEFKGYDWLELAECWLLRDSDDDDKVVNRVREYMRESIREGKCCNQVMLEDLRTFLHKLRENEMENGYLEPLWSGLLSIQDDWTFVKMCDVLLDSMWV